MNDLSGRVLFVLPSSKLCNNLDEDYGMDVSLAQPSGLNAMWRHHAFAIGYYVQRFRAAMKSRTDRYRLKKMSVNQFQLIGDLASHFQSHVDPQGQRFQKWSQLITSFVDAMHGILVVITILGYPWLTQVEDQKVLNVLTILFCTFLIMSVLLKSLRIGQNHQNENKAIAIDLLMIFGVGCYYFSADIIILLQLFKHGTIAYKIYKQLRGIPCFRFIIISVLVAHFQVCVWTILENDTPWYNQSANIEDEYIEGLIWSLQNFYFIAQPSQSSTKAKVLLAAFLITNFACWCTFFRDFVLSIFNQTKQISSKDIENLFISRNKEPKREILRSVEDYGAAKSKQQAEQQAVQTLTKQTGPMKEAILKELYIGSFSSCRMIRPFYSDGMVTALASKFREHFHDPGSIICRPVQALRSLHLMQRGRAIQYFTSKANATPAPACINEEELLLNQRSPLTTEAEGFASTIEIGFDDLLSCLRNNQQTFEKFFLLRDHMTQSGQRNDFFGNIRRLIVDRQLVSQTQDRQMACRKNNRRRYRRRTLQEGALAFSLQYGLLERHELSKKLLIGMGIRINKTPSIQVGTQSQSNRTGPEETKLDMPEWQQKQPQFELTLDIPEGRTTIKQIEQPEIHSSVNTLERYIKPLETSPDKEYLVQYTSGTSPTYSRLIGEVDIDGNENEEASLHQSSRPMSQSTHSRDFGFKSLASMPHVDNHGDFDRQHHYQHFHPEWNMEVIVSRLVIDKAPPINGALNFQSNLSHYINNRQYSFMKGRTQQ